MDSLEKNCIFQVSRKRLAASSISDFLRKFTTRPVFSKQSSHLHLKAKACQPDAHPKCTQSSGPSPSVRWETTQQHLVMELCTFSTTLPRLFLFDFPCPQCLLSSHSERLELSGVNFWGRKCVKTDLFCCVAARVSPFCLRDFHARISNHYSELYTTDHWVINCTWNMLVDKSSWLVVIRRLCEEHTIDGWHDKRP